jgi:Na+-transporting NADH:ubiquinone oxidoreductase subunit A
VYDALVPLDIMTYFLLKAVLSEDIEEAERLGILECDEEDFALCTFACPSKTDVGGIIREGLEYIEREG